MHALPGSKPQAIMQRRIIERNNSSAAVEYVP